WAGTDALTVETAYAAAAVLDDGRVLLAGGSNIQSGSQVPFATSVAYDPLAGTWAPVSDMTEPRGAHSATRLDDGPGPVAGGSGTGGFGSQALATAEIYDPQTDAWTPVASMNHARWDHTATLLADGRVLVTGGLDDSGAIATTEVYDPAADAWTDTGQL